MATHDSVTYCDRCDWLVAVIETSRCEECHAPICVGCAKPTNDPNLLVCSYRCQSIFNKGLDEESNPIVPEAA
jgi:predicted nucleic acid-binding Zn ribbon protein